MAEATSPTGNKPRGGTIIHQANGSTMELLQSDALPNMNIGASQPKAAHGKIRSQASKQKVKTGCLTCRFVVQKH